jgi:hypothetical protein
MLNNQGEYYKKYDFGRVGYKVNKKEEEKEEKEKEEECELGLF